MTCSQSLTIATPSLQHLVFTDGLPSKYQPGLTLQSFQEQMRLGCRGKSETSHQIKVSGQSWEISKGERFMCGIDHNRKSSQVKLPIKVKNTCKLTHHQWAYFAIAHCLNVLQLVCDLLEYTHPNSFGSGADLGKMGRLQQAIIM